MYNLIVLSNFLVISNLVAAQDSLFPPNLGGDVPRSNKIVISNNHNVIENLINNTTYLEHPDNVMRVPYSSNHVEKYEKKFKKMPKRTIQKIIKKNRAKNRKIFLNRATSPAPLVTKSEKLIRIASNERMLVTTKEPGKKTKKYSMNMAKYGNPYHRMNYHNSRKKRSVQPRNDVFILKDLDEVEFLDDQKDYDVVKTHIQNHW